MVKAEKLKQLRGLTPVVVLCLLRDQDLVEALDSGGSDMEMERGVIHVQENSAQHKAKMWKVRRTTGVS